MTTFAHSGYGDKHNTMAGILGIYTTSSRESMDYIAEQLGETATDWQHVMLRDNGEVWVSYNTGEVDMWTDFHKVADDYMQAKVWTS